MTDRSRCRSCSAPILFVAVEPKGRMMPLDLEPDKDGTIVRQVDTYYTLQRGLILGLGEVRYRRHVCPKADTHRKGRK